MLDIIIINFNTSSARNDQNHKLTSTLSQGQLDFDRE